MNCYRNTRSSVLCSSKLKKQSSLTRSAVPSTNHSNQTKPAIAGLGWKTNKSMQTMSGQGGLYSIKKLNVSSYNKTMIDFAESN